MDFRPVGLSIGQSIAGGIDAYLMSALLQRPGEPE
jgi:hypothetical protein